MGFNTVYRALQDVFPQVDSRILRAVAIEHPKDADLAVEAVLVDVIPRLSEQSSTVSSNKSKSSLSLSEGHGKGLEPTTDHEDVISSVSEQSTEGGPSSINGSLLVAMEGLTIGEFSNHDANGETDTCRDGAPIYLEKLGDDTYNNPESASSALICGSGSHDNHEQGFVKTGVEIADSSSKSVAGDAEVPESIQEEMVHQLDVTPPATEVEDGHLYADIEKLIAPALCQTDLAVTQESDLTRSFSKSFSENDTFAIVNLEDESIMNSILTRSNQDCSTELLNDIIEDAGNMKKILVEAMDSVVNLIKEVELKEKAAEQAKEDATRGCIDILFKVDEVKQALRRAKEANEMHAGEVYAEKAILATEMKELQLRLFSMSDERNKSLAILEEMRRTLDMRLATALKEIETAEEERIEKEEYARGALAYQESEMEKVVEESKRLKLEAEENSKLQEFLIDRGRAIDILQGEISVKCQDVKLLKEKFDKGIPLSRSLSSSQTSSILASSGSSFRSTTPLEPDYETYGTPKKTFESGNSFGFLNPSSRSVPPPSPKSPIKPAHSLDGFPSREDKTRDDRKALVDDGWELFDNGELYTGI